MLAPNFCFFAGGARRADCLDIVGHVGPVIGAAEFVIDSVAFYVQHCLVFRLDECYTLALGNKDPWYASFVR